MAKKKTKSVSRSNRNFSIGEAISYGFGESKKRIGFFAKIILTIAASSFIPSLLTSMMTDNGNGTPTSFLIQLVAWVIQMAVGLGAINITLRLYDKKKTEYSHLWKNFYLIIPYFLATVVYTLIVIAGFILIIIPGIYWGIKYQYYSYLMVDRGMGPIDAIKMSGKITEGVKWKLFWFKFVLAFINIAGLLCLIVGLFVTIPLTMMAEAYVYRKLSGSR
ncbi:MAG TPA: DUF975 family protein [Patescibacteria group bacterium]|nr:DUF975 family protein [Patescibacteria group bacterium]